jgi:phosphonate transport system substrate-binding protein
MRETDCSGRLGCARKYEVTKGDKMKPSSRLHATVRVLRMALMLLAVGTGASAMAQKPAGKAATPAGQNEPRMVLAVNEGGAANADYVEILQRYEEFALLIGKALKAHVSVVSVRNRDRLQENLKKQAYEFLLARPNDVPALAVRDFGYQPVATAKQPYQTLFIVPKGSTLKTIADVRGKTIVTPDQYSNMWRAANAMLRDSKIDMSKEKVKAMRDQAAIAWSLENGFYDVGVVNSASAVGRTWEKNGGRIIAKSADQINMPFIASPTISEAQVVKLRAAVLALDATEGGQAILKKIGLPAGFKETPREEFVAFLKWLGEEVRPL